MKNKFVGLITVGFVIFSLALPASAHVLKTDGSIGAVMHTDPDDEPVAGKPTLFFLEIKDVQGKFRSENCDCIAQILQNKSLLYTVKLYQSTTTADSNTPVFSFVFPKKNAYTLKVEGMPKQAGDFQAFNLVYDILVDKEDFSAAATTTPGSASPRFSVHFVHYVLFGGAFVGVLVWDLREKRKLRRTQEKNNQKIE